MLLRELVFLLLLTYCTITCANIRSQTTFPVIINGQQTYVTTAEMEVNAAQDQLNISNINYSLNYTWSIFQTDFDYNVSIYEWGVKGKCSCWELECGDSCDKENCEEHWLDKDASCSRFSDAQNYCYNVYKVGVNPKTIIPAYQLTHLATIALTDFGGINSTFESPGFTVSDQRHGGMNYSSNILIREKYPLEKKEIANFRYIHGEYKRIVNSGDLRTLADQPIINVNWGATKCSSWTRTATMITSQSGNNITALNRTDLQYYLVYEDAKKNLTTLRTQNILMPQGVVDYKGSATFDIFDPCNQLFLTIYNQNETYFTRLPSGQSLSHKDKKICVAVSITPTEFGKQLMLYEFANGTNLFQPSTGFKGILSDNYVATMGLTITMDQNFTLAVRAANIFPSFLEEGGEKFLQVETSVAIKCDFYLSPTCNITLTTREDQHIASKSISHCGWLNKRVNYYCEGIVNSFNPPREYTTPLDSEFIKQAPDQMNNTSQAPERSGSGTSLWASFTGWIGGLSWGSIFSSIKWFYLTYVFVIVLAGGIVLYFYTKGPAGFLSPGLVNTQLPMAR